METQRNTQHDARRAAELYGISARYYDLVYGEQIKIEDLPFYRELARETGDPVLELGCGTGRIALPLLRDGHTVTGLDQSAEMLDIFRRKLKNEPRELSRAVNLVHGDMANFSLDRRYRLITVPFRSFQHLLEPAAQRSCLECVAQHLEPDGVFVFNVFNPNLVFIADAVKLGANWRLDAEAAGLEGEIMRRYHQLRPDPGAQVHELWFKYETYDRFGALKRTEVEKMQLRWLYRWEAEYLLELSGLEIIDAFGNYDRRPLDSSASELIYLCRRAG